MDDPILDRAADLWVEAQLGGHPCDDADLIIAASAMVTGSELVIGNTRHFSWISGLTVRNWRLP